MNPNPFEFTTSVVIELSNLCQFAWLHKKCPLFLGMASPWLVKEPKILPAGIVYKVLDALGRCNYAGNVYFHQYNEPLMDPRLFLFLDYARHKCPRCEVRIETNGHYLSLTLAQELAEVGVTTICVSLYGAVEEIEVKRLRIEEWAQQLPIHLGFVDRRCLDDRLRAYSRLDVNRPLPCKAPLGQVIITKEAKVSLCCMDWQESYTFGDLNKQSLEEILCSEEMRETYQRLSSGDRFLDICKRCVTGR